MPYLVVEGKAEGEEVVGRGFRRQKESSEVFTVVVPASIPLGSQLRIGSGGALGGWLRVPNAPPTA